MRRPTRRQSKRRVRATTIAVTLLFAGVTGCGDQGETSPPPPTLTPTASVSPTPSPSPSVSPTHSSSPTTSPTATPSPTGSSLPPGLAGHVISRVPTSRHVVVLSFDGGSGNQGAASVLSTLAATGVPATFFLTGRFVETYPATARAIAASGVVGNHTVTHPHSTRLSSGALRGEVRDAEAAITAAIGRSTRPWFRFPYGEYDGRTLGVVNGLGYAAIGWTIDTRGWEGRHGAGTVDDIVARVLAKVQPGAIVLMHLGAASDGSTLDADALPAMITALRGAGYSFTTVDTLR